MSHWSLTSRIALAAALLTLVMALTGGSISYYAMSHILRENLQTQLNHNIEDIAHYLGQKFTSLEENLNSLSNSVVIGNALVDNMGRETYLRDFLQDFAQITHLPVTLALTDFLGRPYAKTNAHSLLSPPGWAEEIVNSGNKNVLCVESGSDIYFILGAPVVYANTGMPEGAILMQFQLDRLIEEDKLPQFFSSLVESHPPGVKLYFEHPECKTNFQVYGRLPPASNISESSTLELDGFLKSLNLRVEVLTHTYFFDQPLRDLLKTYLLLGGVVLVLVVIISRLLASSLTRGLRNLRDSAQDIAKGRTFSGRLPEDGPEEMARVGEAFNQVLHHLEQAYREIQRNHIRLQKATEESRRAEMAEAANRAKSAFLANMSHELRTPLNAITGYAQILEKDAGMSEEQRHGIEIIHRSSDYLLTLINDILDLAKIEADRLELQPDTWEPAHFFRGLREMFELRARQKGIAFYYQTQGRPPASLYCDEKRLRQILINLLGNAIKFTEQGEVRLKVGFSEHCLELTVTDTGIGIDPENLENIFEPFRQSGDNYYKMQGTGLGLAITRKLVDLMGASLEVDSEPGKGSCFRVSLPISAQARAVETGEETWSVSSRITGYQRQDGEAPYKVLVVDDTEDNRRVLVGLLQPLGFWVREANSGRECLGIAQEWQPEVIFMDLRMAGLDGLETTEKLRQFSEFRHTLIVAVSASVFEKNRQQSLAAGCDEHLPKPLDFARVLATLERFLPLQWIYSEAPLTAETAASPLPAPTPLNEEEKARALELVKQGNARKLLELLGELAGHSTQAAELMKLAKNFRLKEIRRRLES